jgi:hypothetical protein
MFSTIAASNDCGVTPPAMFIGSNNSYAPIATDADAGHRNAPALILRSHWGDAITGADRIETFLGSPALP